MYQYMQNVFLLKMIKIAQANVQTSTSQCFISVSVEEASHFQECLSLSPKRQHNKKCRDQSTRKRACVCAWVLVCALFTCKNQSILCSQVSFNLFFIDISKLVAKKHTLMNISISSTQGCALSFLPFRTIYVEIFLYLSVVKLNILKVIIM